MKFRKPTKHLGPAVVLMVICLIIYQVDTRTSWLEQPRRFFALALSPVHAIAYLPKELSAWADEAMTSRGELEDELERLKVRNLILEAKIQKFTNVLSERAQLIDLLGSSAEQSDAVQVTRIIGEGAALNSQLILVDKGAFDGVFEGQPLLDSTGFVGQVVRVNWYSAWVMLLTDLSNSIPVKVQRNGLRAIAVGTGEANRMVLPRLPDTADIKVGDQLVSSGLGGRFPEGYPVGTVISKRHETGAPFSIIQVETKSQLDRLRYMLLVYNEKEQAAWQARYLGVKDKESTDTVNTAEEAQ